MNISKNNMTDKENFFSCPHSSCLWFSSSSVIILVAFGHLPQKPTPFIPLSFLLINFFSFCTRCTSKDTLSSSRILLCTLLCTNRKEFSNDFKRHALGFGDLQENKPPSNEAYNGIDTKNTGQTNAVQHYRKRVRDNNIAKPKDKSTNGNAEATNSCRKDF